MSIPPEISKLVERFDSQREAYQSGKYNEAQIRAEFIDPLFKALGWDIHNEQGNAEAYKDVVHEDAIKIGGVTEAPDLCFRIGGTRKFFVECKKPSVNIKDDVHPAYQLRRYAWSAKLPLSILTDFDELAVYDCRAKPNKNDTSAIGRLMYFTSNQFAEKWDEFAAIFSREAILKGSFDKFAESTKGKKGTASVDNAFLEEIERWRDILARNIAMRNEKLSQRELNFSVQRIIDRIIFLRICEDRGIEPYGRLMTLRNGERAYPRLCEFFQRADERYNSGLFHFQSEKDRPEAPDELTLKLKIDDKVLKDIVGNLYYPESPYEFSVLPADILGQVYERFLGKVIRLTAGHQAKVEDKPEVRKAGGVYYTPTYIVDYIVKNTVGKLLEGKTPRQAAKLKILDPACGSGSFLLGAYQFLLDWHLVQYVKEPENWKKGREPKLYQHHKGGWKLTTAERKRILLNNIYGVDIDSQAVEVTKLSLLLKVLEGESQETITKQFELFHQRALPDLGSNIKCGNSLIGPDFYQSRQMDMFNEEDKYRINAFDWNDDKQGFGQIIKSAGFDVVIGNPPWGAAFSEPEKEYFATYSCFQGNHDSYLFFIERTDSLLKSGGMLSYVTPDSWIKIPQAMNLRRFVLKSFGVHSITILPQNVFRGVSANCIIFLLVKGAKATTCSVKLFFPSSELVKLGHGEFDDNYTVNPGDWTKSEDKQFQIYQTDEIARVINRVRVRCSDAVNFLDVMQGIVPYSKEQHSQEIIQQRKFHAPRKLSDEYGPWIQGRTITRYQMTLKDVEYLRYGPWLHRPRKVKYFQGDRILIQEITGGHPPRISASYYDKIAYHDPGIISCLVVGNLDIMFILGILNSKFLGWYHRHTSPKGMRSLFPKVLIGDIRSFPIPNLLMDNPADKSRHDRMVALVASMLDLYKKVQAARTPDEKTRLEREIAATDRQIDALVYELYGLTASEIDIVEGAIRSV